MGVQFWGEIFEITVVGKYPVATPELAHKGVAVLQTDDTLRRFANVGDDVGAFNRVFADQFGDGRVDGAFVVNEVAQAFVFKKSDAPAIGVIAGIAGTLAKTGKAKTHIGRRVAVHSKQLAHGLAVSMSMQKR